MTRPAHDSADHAARPSRTRRFSENTALILAVGLLIGGLSTLAWAQVNRAGARLTEEQAKRFMGPYYSYSAVEEFEMSVGLDGGGRHSSVRPREEVRHHLNIPAHYGELIHISDINHDSVFWFRDESGIIRNAVFRDIDSALYRLQCFETVRYESKWIRP